MDDALKQRLQQGRELFEHKQYAQAERLLSEIAQAHPSFADVHNMLGVILHDQGHFTRAQKAFEAALRANPGYTDASLNLAVLLNDTGRYEEARGVYEAAFAHRKTEPGALDRGVQAKLANLYAELADAWRAAGRREEAAAEYRRALALGEGYVDIRLKLATVLRELGQGEAAVAELARVTAEKPAFASGWVHYGLALEAAGRTDEAAGAFERALSVDPSHRTARLYLSWARKESPAR
jgi:tetratricopeptide (TPR) repeat protein